MKKNNINGRNILFLGSWLSIYFLALNATFSILSKTIAVERNWDVASITDTYALYLLIFSVIGIFAGKYADKNGCRMNMFIGGIICGGGWILTGMSSSVLMFYINFGVITSIGAGIMYNPLLTQTLKFFPESRGKASGLLLSAASIGPFIMAPVFTTSFAAMGVRTTLLILGIAIIAVNVIFSPIQKKAEVQPGKSSSTIARDEGQYSPKQMLSSITFYKMLFIFMAVACAGNMMIGVLYSIAQNQIQVSLTTAAMAVSVSTISNFTGRLSFGVIYDKIGAFKSLILSLGITTVAMIAVSLIGANMAVPFFVVIAFLGFAFGGPMVVFPPLTGRTFGTKYLGTNYGIIFLGYSLAGFVGPKLATFFNSQFGVYTYGYYAAAILAVLGIFVVLNLKKELEAREQLDVTSNSQSS